MQALLQPQFNMLALAKRIEPLESALLAVQSHKGAVRARLQRSFVVSGMRDIGSHTRGTAIRTYSDVDCMVVLAKDEITWGGRMIASNTVVGRVLAELRSRFPASEVRKDGLAATISFGSTNQSMDVVPAVFTRFDRTRARPVFLIPDGLNGWFETSPHAHDHYFAQAQAASGNKVRKVSQLIKWWKYARAKPLPLGSFYSDMVLASSKICSIGKSHGQCLHDFFELLALTKCGAVKDPCEIVERILATNTEAQRVQLVSSVEHAWRHARAALDAQARGRISDANAQWDIVFNGRY
ncbi:SMODS domain-containing nucleotidyltransferase [Roseateles sp. So40a]|uniref:SMODS domain-containing nucleotidyltransferase n=1 Tax=Roseateles sp. So40a TaxID=3400226 RepID=UPI003A89A992